MAVNQFFDFWKMRATKSVVSGKRTEKVWGIKKLQPVTTNAVTGCCSPQNIFEDIQIFETRKNFS